jgi:hypothetical protein
MKGILTFKNRWKFVLAFLILFSYKPCVANFQAGEFSFPVFQNECLISVKSLNGIYRNLIKSETTYLIQVDNKGSQSVTIDLTAQPQNKNCLNPDNSDNSKNPDLLLTLSDPATNLPVSRLNINPGTHAAFVLKVVAPAGSPVRTWSCHLLKVASAGCNEVTLTLFSFNPDPSMEE